MWYKLWDVLWFKWSKVQHFESKPEWYHFCSFNVVCFRNVKQCCRLRGVYSRFLPHHLLILPLHPIPLLGNSLQGLRGLCEKVLTFRNYLCGVLCLKLRLGALSFIRTEGWPLWPLRRLGKGRAHLLKQKFMSWSHCQELGQLADLASDWLFTLIQPIRSQLNTCWHSSWQWLQLIKFRPWKASSMSSMLVPSSKPL